MFLFAVCVCFVFFKQKTAYEMRISDWSSDVCSSDLRNLALIEPRHRGRPSATRFSTAVAQSGEFQVELIEQHDDGPSVYRDTVAPGATGLHHVAIIAGGFDAALGHYTAQGFEVGADGRFGDMRYAYVDTSPALGHMVEIVEDKPAIDRKSTRLNSSH